MSALQHRLRGVLSRLVKVENLVKYILTHCCEYEAGYPEVDFIVDRFDRGDKESLGRHWVNASSMGVRSEGAISLSGSSLDNSLGMNASCIAKIGNVDLETPNKYYPNYVFHSASANQSCISPDTFRGELPEENLLTYKGLLSSANQIIEIEFEVIEQTLFNDWSALSGYSNTEYVAPTSVLIPVARFDKDAKRGLFVESVFSHALGFSHSISDVHTMSAPTPPLSVYTPSSDHWQPPYNGYDSSYIRTHPINPGDALYGSQSIDVSVAVNEHVGHGVALKIFSNPSSGLYDIFSPGEWQDSEGRGSNYASAFSADNEQQQERFITYCWDASGGGACTNLIFVNLDNYLTTYWNSMAIPLAVDGRAYGYTYSYEDHAGAVAHIGINTLRVECIGDAVTVLLNGSVLYTYTQASILSGSQVGLLSAGNITAILSQYGNKMPARILSFRAWSAEKSPPPPNESGHGTYDEGDAVWLDVYHTRVKDEGGNVTWIYDPLAQDD